ncbi:nucleotide exchange factor SIL1 [Coturnix japonica]|uniref:Nucleotide exchange factor SIL1 n=1 Tax=Coturnix japonica TaxID=93934 RepID=A0A8C2TJP0_COTJA|nr:nucleotide exchange factor SIL1 [Coturnix japonica]XP_015731508.1 nucleotide exchange factor SIL1 [Coturnix japonica]XP_015731509.1 nucleotide exchange factor SIL1 [Coturnix japonica]XP_015731510.1 nucleotide exchange factor SIL1 [Coturnix japonica]
MRGWVAMSHWAGLLCTAAKVSLLLLLVSAVFFQSSLSDRVPEFALTKIEESDIKDDSGKEPITDDDADPEDLEVFYPTHQWQAVRPGQAVPAGSHVRLNLQTGEREARLPDSESGKSDAKEEKRRRRLNKMDIDTNSFTSQELKKALAKMKENEKAERTAHEEEVRKKFRPIEQLKEEFEKLNVKMETDYEIMDKLISKFNSSASTLDEKVAALYDLEYYVHQVDNAKDFLSMGGLRLVIEGLNSTEAVLKEHAAFVLGAALSSNPKVQVEAIEGGALQKLLVIVATEQPQAVKKKALFALSSLLRHFPYAQQQFLKLGGLQVLRGLFRQPGTSALCVRAVTLLYDLIVEKMLLEDSQHSDHMEKVQQYRRVQLVPAVLEQDWCVAVPGLLALPEHDAREKVLKAVSVLMELCRERFRGDTALSATLGMLRSEYEELAAAERRDGDGDGYFQELLGAVNSIVRELS